MQRKQFIKSSCNLCLLTASGFLMSDLIGCSPAYRVIKTEVVNNQIQIPVAGFAQSSLLFIRPRGWYYDIAVQKKENNTYEALLLQCTHQSNQLTPNGHGYTCNLHGSQFDSDGIAKKGPAEKPLKKYSIMPDKENLIIDLNQS